MPTKFQHLVQFVGQYSKKARKLTQYADVLEEDILAFELGCYLSMIEPSIAAIPGYKPIKELDMVLYVAEKLKESGSVSQMKDYWDALYKHGQTLVCLLSKTDRPLTRSYLEKLSVYDDGLAEAFSYMTIEENDPLDKSAPADPSKPSLDTPELERKMALNAFGFEDAEDNVDLLKSYFRILVIRFAANDLYSLKMIARLFVKFEDRRQLALSLIEAYQETYDSYLGTWAVNHRNRLLDKFDDLTSTLEDILPPKEIVALMRESGFDLRYPGGWENDDAYRRFSLERNIYLSELSLSLLDEEDYYSTRMMSRIAASVMSGVREELSLEEHQACLTGTLPPLVQLALDSDGERTKTTFMTFFSIFNKVNKSADKQHYRHPDLFFIRHQAAIAEHIQLFGLEGVKTLTKQLASTVVSLERYLENIPVVEAAYIDPLRAFFARHKAIINKNSDEKGACYKIMQVLSVLYEIETNEMREADIAAYKDLMIKEMAGETPRAYLQVLLQKLLSSMLGAFDVDVAKIDVDAIFKRMPPEKFTQLVAASLYMQDSPYRDVFRHLLYLDLTGGDIDAFLHKLEQAHHLGQSLAEHNQRIQDKLKAQGINPSDALKYRKTRELIIYPSDREAVKTDNALTVLWGYCTAFQAPLKEKIEALQGLGEGISAGDKKILQQCLSIQKQYGKLEAEMKEKTSVHTVLAKSSSLALLDKIERNLKAFQEVDKKQRDAGEGSLFTADFMEFLGHVRAQYDVCKQLMSVRQSSKKERSQEIHHFRILQWDKTHPMTSFLGDEVGCCLGSTSSQFPALVQRRMDDGMLFHVAVDLKTNKPRALIWLYLAEKPNGKIALIANFFEVNTKYALEESSRKALLNGLLAFTNDYCKDNPNIDGFYMNRLDYGWNANDLNSYPLVALDLKDKLGGPFVPGATPADLEAGDVDEVRALTVHHYYLASLAKVDKRFHEFSEEVLENEKSPHAIALAELLKQSVEAIKEANVGLPALEEVKAIIIREHGLEIAPFFVEPLSSSPHFHDLLDIVYQTVVCDDAMSREREVLLPDAAAGPAIDVSVPIDDEDALHSPEKLLAAKGMFGSKQVSLPAEVYERLRRSELEESKLSASV